MTCQKCSYNRDDFCTCSRRGNGHIRAALADILILVIWIGLLYIGLWITP